MEVTAEASETRKVFANPDGTMTAHLFGQPVQVRQGAGWVPVDTSLVAHPDGTVTPRAIAASLTLSGGESAAPLARLAAGDQALELSWPGVLPRPRLDGDTAVYADVSPGVDLQVRATAQGFAPLLVVKDRAAARHVTKIAFGQRVTGKPASFNVGAPAMWDASGTGPAPRRGGPRDGARLGRATARLTDGKLTVTLDDNFLADPASVYPLAIAPPDYNRSVWESGWAKVMSGKPGNSYWLGGVDGGEAKVGYCGWAYCNGIGVVRSYFQYDHQGFLFGKSILSAQFNAHEFYAPSCSARWVNLWQTDPINPGTTWNNQPWSSRVMAGQYNVAYGYSGTCPANWLGFDLTTLVRHRIAQGSNLLTYALAAGDESDALAWKKFDWNPSLIVHYNTPPSVPDNLMGGGVGCATQPNEPYTPDATPELRAAVSDPDGGLVQAHFEWWNRGGSRVGDNLTSERSSGSTFTAEIPPGAFQDGSKIAWRVQGWDGRDWSPFSQWCDITVDQTPPAGEPLVSSTDYPPDTESGAPGTTGTFRFASDSADTDVTGFKYSLVNSPPDQYVSAPGGDVTVPITPASTGPQFLYVQSIDRAGNPGPITTYQFVVGLPTPPAGYWRLDGFGADTAAPDATGAHNGTVTGGGSWTTGRVQDAVHLNGSNGYVGTTGGPAIRTDTSFTVSAWVKAEALGSGMRTAVSLDGGQVSAFLLGYRGDSGKWSLLVPGADAASGGGSFSLVAASTPPVLNRWTHLVGVYDPGAREIRLYVDGALAGTATRTSPWYGPGGLQIGRAKWNGVPVDHWQGAIDDVKVYQRALPSAEISALATQPVLDEGRWMLDEGTGVTAGDVSGNYRTGTLSGGATWAPGRVGSGSVQLDGTGSVGASGPAARTDSSFTVSAWVKADALGSGATLRTAVSQDGGQVSGFRLGYQGDIGKWALSMPSSDSNAASAVVAAASVAPTVGQWTHLAGVFDRAARQARIYVNGRASGTGPLPGSWIPWNASGALQIGRGKANGGPGQYWQGAVDDVHVYAGVRTDQEIRNEWLVRPGAPTTPYTGSFGRFVNHDGDHLTMTGPIPRGYHFEGPLGWPAPTDAPDTHMLYACKLGTDLFTSPQADCEGYPKLGEIGRVYLNPPVGIPTYPLYRCAVAPSGEHFDSPAADCEGQRVDGLLGYVRAYAPLVGHVQPDPPGEHRSSIRGVPPTYRWEGALGLVGLKAMPGTRAVYLCQDATDSFTSLDQACEGKQLVGSSGYIWIDPPPDGQESALLYRCRMTDGGEYFDSLYEDCGGQTVDRPLGYVITHL